MGLLCLIRRYLQSLTRLATNYHRDKNPRPKNTSASGLGFAECQTIVSNEFLEYVDKESSLSRKLFSSLQFTQKDDKANWNHLFPLNSLNLVLLSAELAVVFVLISHGLKVESLWMLDSNKLKWRMNRLLPFLSQIWFLYFLPSPVHLLINFVICFCVSGDLFIRLFRVRETVIWQNVSRDAEFGNRGRGFWVWRRGRNTEFSVKQLEALNLSCFISDSVYLWMLHLSEKPWSLCSRYVLRNCSPGVALPL